MPANPVFVGVVLSRFMDVMLPLPIGFILVRRVGAYTSAFAYQGCLV